MSNGDQMNMKGFASRMKSKNERKCGPRNAAVRVVEAEASRRKYRILVRRQAGQEHGVSQRSA